MGRPGRGRARESIGHLNDLMTLLRIADVQKVEDVAQAILEPNGELSVQRVTPARPAEKRDISS